VSRLLLFENSIGQYPEITIA